MKEKLAWLLKKFFFLNVLIYIFLYVRYLVESDFLKKIARVAQGTLTVNATIAAVATGTLVAIFLLRTVTSRQVALRHIKLTYLKISGFATSLVVETSAILILMKGMAPFVGLAIIKGAVYPASALVDWYKYCREQASLSQVPSLRHWLFEKEKIYELIAMFVALLGVFLIAWAKLPKDSSALSKIFFAAAAIGVVTYSVGYGIRQHFMTLYRENLKTWLDSEEKERVLSGKLKTKEEIDRWRLLEELRACFAFPAIEQLYCFLFFLLQAVIVLTVARYFSLLPPLEFHAASIKAGMPYGALALFSVLILMAPFKKGKDDASMLFRNLVHKAGGIIAGIITMLWFGYHYAPQLIALHQQVWPTTLELVGSGLVVLAMVIDHPLRWMVRLLRFLNARRGSVPPSLENAPEPAA